jgi:hypothetical protein
VWRMWFRSLGRLDGRPLCILVVMLVELVGAQSGPVLVEVVCRLFFASFLHDRDVSDGFAVLLIGVGYHRVEHREAWCGGCRDAPANDRRMGARRRRSSESEDARRRAPRRYQPSSRGDAVSAARRAGARRIHSSRALGVLAEVDEDVVAAVSFTNDTAAIQRPPRIVADGLEEADHPLGGHILHRGAELEHHA